MTNYREILRLSSLGLNKTQIAQSIGCSRTTVIQVLNIAEEKGISYPLPNDLSDRKLSELLFPSNKAKPEYKMPDYAYVEKELRRNGVTFNQLWLEYVEHCRQNGELPYQLTQFKKHYYDHAEKKQCHHAPESQAQRYPSGGLGGNDCTGHRHGYRRSNPCLCICRCTAIQRLRLCRSVLLYERGKLDHRSCKRL